MSASGWPREVRRARGGSLGRGVRLPDQVTGMVIRATLGGVVVVGDPDPCASCCARVQWRHMEPPEVAKRYVSLVVGAPSGGTVSGESGWLKGVRIRLTSCMSRDAGASSADRPPKGFGLTSSEVLERP